MARSPKLKTYFSTPLDKPLVQSPPIFFISCFFILILSNSLLSHFNLSLSVKIWIFLLGLAIPLFFLFKARMKEKDLFQKETLDTIPAWLWVLLGLAAVFLRFYRLTTLSSWPLVDEGIGGYFAVNLMEKWNWDLLQGASQTPRLYTWLQALLFKTVPPSLFTLWLYPALWSALCVPMAWFASRRFFSRSFAVLATAVAAFSFWPLSLGRYSAQAITLVFWEYLALFILASYLKDKDSPAKNKKILWLGLVTGLGFYTYFSWVVVAFLIGLAVLTDRSVNPRRRGFLFFLFALLAACVAAPLGIALLGEYRGYFHHLWTNDWNNNWRGRIDLAFSYFRGLFWGKSGGFFDYGPLWGGLLNPVLTSLFFWGLVDLLRSFRKPMSLWILSTFPLFFLPAVLTNDFEMMRLTQLIPLLTLVCALGAQSILFLFPAPRRLLALFLVLAGSTSFDLYHLFQAYPHHWNENPSYYGNHKSAEFYKAYSLIKPLAERDGPGLVLLNFNPDPYDQTLFVASYSFNAGENPKLNPTQATWAAVLTNIHEEPYFKKVFPEAKWAWLSEGLNRRDGGFILEVIPVTLINKSLLSRWTTADKSLKGLTKLVMDLGVDPDQSQMMEVLDKAYPTFKGDPLLESRYWRIRALHHAAAGKTGEAVQDEKNAIEKGLPMAQLYNDMGSLLYKEKNLVEAQKAFEGALRLKLNLTDASENLKNLPPARQ